MNKIKNAWLVFMLFAVPLSLFGQQLPKKAEDISPLLIGEPVPAVQVQTVEGQNVNFAEVVKGKKTILLFYRGGWCPYCNMHLSEVGKQEQKLLDMGYQIVAISPDAPASLQETMNKNQLNYTLLSDSEAKLMKAMGIAFKASEKQQGRLSQSSGGKNKGILPVPTLFIVGEEGEIRFEYINPDYKTRISNELLMAVASSLQ